jgi:hypothetical protein
MTDTSDGPVVPDHLIDNVARLIGVDPKDKWRRQMINYGLRSGFPVCCIAFFVKVWCDICPPENRRAEYHWLVSSSSRAYMNYRHWHDRVKAYDGARMRCPACMLKALANEYGNGTLEAVEAFYAEPEVKVAIERHNAAGEANFQRVITEGRCKDPYTRWDGK